MAARAAAAAALLALASAQAAPKPTFLLDAAQQTGDAVKDLVAGIEFGSMATTSVGGVKAWDLESATLTRSGGATLTEGQEYTHAFCARLPSPPSPTARHPPAILRVGVSLSACAGLQWTPKRFYRTLFHHSLSSPATPDHKGDHCQFTQMDTLGVRSNRAPADGTPEFNACTPAGACYNVTANTTWSFVVAVGKGTNATSPMGTTTFYVGGPSEPVNVGSAARTCCGMSFDRVGWPGPGNANQGPGKVAAMAGWNIALSPAEITAVFDETKPKYL